MALRIRRGTNAQRSGQILEQGEIVWTTDAQQLWVGDGVNQGGVPVVGTNVAGYGLTFNGTSRKLEVAGLTTDDVAQGTNNKYFANELAQDSAASLFTTGSHTGITFQYNDIDGKINATVNASAFVDLGITDVVLDTSPQLGGNLDLNSRNITGTGNINITGSISASVGLGSNLNLNQYNISGTGAIAINGYVSDNVIQSSSNGPNSSQTFIGTLTRPVELEVRGTGQAMNLLGLSTGGGSSIFTFKHSNGTFTSPTITADQDAIGAIEFRARNGTEYVPSSIVVALVTDSTILSNSTSIDSTMLIGNTNAILANTGNFLSVGPTGITSAPIFKVGDVAGTLPSAPQAGMIVLDGTTFKGYNGSAWVNLN